MEYAYNQNLEIIYPEKDVIGSCPECGDKVFSKCGEYKEWHFSHYSGKECCDGFGTKGKCEWHTNWQNKFPKERQEIRIIKNNKLHIADAITKNGIVVEFQHSQISPSEIKKREDFYVDMVWVFDCTEIRNHFSVLTKFPQFENVSWQNKFGKIIDEKWMQVSETSWHKLDETYVNKFKEIKKFVYEKEYEVKWSYEKKYMSTCTKHAFIDIGKNMFLHLKRKIDFDRFKKSLYFLNEEDIEMLYDKAESSNFYKIMSEKEVISFINNIKIVDNKL